MFLFKQEHVEPILNGTKTQTRRLHKRRRAIPGSLHWAQRGMRADTRFARLKITRVWQERLYTISTADALAEGYASRDEYWDVFERINKGKQHAANPAVWCYEFELEPAERIAR